MFKRVRDYKKLACPCIIDFPSLELRGLVRTMKNSPKPSLLPHQTLQLALCVLLASFKPRFVCRTARWWSITPENGFPLLQSPMAASFTSLQLTLGILHGDLRLVCSCSAMETHFIKLLTNNYCTDVASRGSLELGSECCNRGQTIPTHYALSTWWSCSVSLCGLPLRGWAVPRLFHFTVTALTVDRGSSSRAEIWWTDLLERWHPMTVPPWKSLSSSVRPFYCQRLSMEIAWRCARFYTPVCNMCGWNSWIH